MKRKINYGKITLSRWIKVNDNDYHLEEATFNSYQESISNTYKVVDDLVDQYEVLERKCDLYDWTGTILRTQNTTIEIRNIRPQCKIIIAESKEPCSIEQMENDSPILRFLNEK
jgi:hypothetical protein